MPIELIDKIKPKNNGTFPMIDAEDVLMIDGRRLTEHTIVNSTTLPSSGIVEPNVMYFLGQLSKLSVGFPSVGKLGDMIYISFSSGSTSPTLTITTNNHIGLSQLLVNANQYYELIGVWNGTSWVFTKNEVPQNEVN